MPTPCAACSSEARREIERRIRSGASLVDVARYTRETAPPGISRQALSRHARSHMALPPRTAGPRPVSSDFLRDVVAVAGERMASGEIAPGIRDGISAQVALDARASKHADHELMLQLAAVLGGATPYVIEGEYTDMDAERDHDLEEARLLSDGMTGHEVRERMAAFRDKQAAEARARLRN